MLVLKFYEIFEILNFLGLKIDFAEISYINKGLLSLFNGYGGQYIMGRGVDIPMVYRPPPTHGISTPLPYTIIDF
jgi:hypothetical protein